MARLQRKKQASAKKKASPEAGGAAASGSVTGDAVAPEVGERVPAEKEKKEVRKRSAPAPVRRAAAERQPPGKIRQLIDRAVQFLREVKVELKKVTWPSRKQTVGSTVVVIVLVLVISLFLGVVDVGLSSLIRVVLQQG